MANPFTFDIKKSMQSVAFLLRSAPGRRMNAKRLASLLYLAERETLADSGLPLTGSEVAMTDRGPGLLDIDLLIRSKHRLAAQWSQHFTLENDELVAVGEDPSFDRLSKFVVRKLSELEGRHANDDALTLDEVVRRLPEFANVQQRGPVPLEAVLKAVGRLDDMPQIIEYANAYRQ